MVTLGSGGAGRAFSCADPELCGQVRSSAGVRAAGAGGQAGGRPPVGRAPVGWAWLRPVRPPARPPSAPSSLSAAPAAAAELAMGAQDRPQCHFDIEINREPGEPGPAAGGGMRCGAGRGWGGAGGRPPAAPAVRVAWSPA